jgi:hypothetical protein
MEEKQQLQLLLLLTGEWQHLGNLLLLLLLLVFLLLPLLPWLLK